MDTANIPARPVLSTDPRWIIAVFDIPHAVNGESVLDILWQVFKPKRRWLKGGWTYKRHKSGQVITILDDPESLDEVRQEMVASAAEHVPFEVPVQIAYGFNDFAAVSDWEMLRGRAR